MVEALITYIVGVHCVCRSLKATAIDAGLRLHASATVHFDSELPHYGTRDGVHRDPHGKKEEHNPITFLNYFRCVVIIRFRFHVLQLLPIKFTQRYFLITYEDVVQSVSSMCLSGVCSFMSLNHTPIKYRGPIKKSDLIITPAYLIWQGLYLYMDT